MTDSCKINKIILHLHIEFRPSHHAVHTGVYSGGSRTFLWSKHSRERRVVRQRTAFLIDINNIFHQFLLETQHHEIGCEVAGEEIAV